MDSIAIGWCRPGEYSASPEFHLTPPSHAVRNQGAFIFCHGTTNLQQEVVVRVVAQGLVEKVDLTPILLEFFKQHHLMDVVACQSIRTRDPEVGNRGLTDPITKSVEPRSVECGATIAIVTENVVSKQALALAVQMHPQAL